MNVPQCPKIHPSTNSTHRSNQSMRLFTSYNVVKLNHKENEIATTVQHMQVSHPQNLQQQFTKLRTPSEIP